MKQLLIHILVSVLVGVVVAIVLFGLAALFAQLALPVIAGFFTAAAVPGGILAALLYGLTQRPQGRLY